MIRFIIKLYIFIVIIDAILSYFPSLRRQEWARFIKKLADFTQKPIRQYIPRDWPVDPSPIVVIILLQILMSLW